ncbi:MAG TPA: glycosyltransferase family 2 protein, partial [Anaerolineaceae bacterium]
YGYWKLRMLRRYPATIRWRQALPPVFVLSLAVLGIASLALAPARWMLGLEVLGYAAVLILAGIEAAARRADAGMIIGLPLAIATMHIAWGTGFLWSGLRTAVRG